MAPCHFSGQDYLARYCRGWIPSWKCSKHYFMALKPIWSSDQHTDHHPGDFGSIQRTQRYVLQENAYLFRFPKKNLLLRGRSLCSPFLRVHPHSRIYDQHTKFSMGQMRFNTLCGWTMAWSSPLSKNYSWLGPVLTQPINGSGYK